LTTGVLIGLGLSAAAGLNAWAVLLLFNGLYYVLPQEFAGPSVAFLASQTVLTAAVVVLITVVVAKLVDRWLVRRLKLSPRVMTRYSVIRRTVVVAVVIVGVLSALLVIPGVQAVAGSIGELGLTVITGSTVRIQGFEALLPTRWITAGASGNEGDVYHHYVSGERKVTVFLTRWESLRDGDEFLKGLRVPNRTIFRVGANIVVLVGDFGDKGQALASDAVRGVKFWAGD